MVERSARCSRAAALAPLLALLGGCQGYFAGGMEALFYTRYIEPTFERSSDLMAPEAVRITSSADREIGLAWNPVLVGDVAGYAITRSELADGPYSMIGRSSGRFAGVFNDAGIGATRLGDGKTYHYRIHAFDGEGRVARQYASITARTDARPTVPTGFQAYSNLPRRIALSWEPSLSSAVVGYQIFRSPSLGGSFEALTYVDGRLNTVFEDPVPGDLRVMYYRIAAVNRFGGPSDLGEPVRAVTKAEPLPPTGLEASSPNLGQIDLRWKPNVETDLTRYEIWRELDDQSSARPVASVQPDSTKFSDRSLGCGQRVRYRLRAVDRDGLVSAFSDPLDARALDLGLELATRPSGALELRWKPERTQGWPAVRLVQQRSLLPDRELGTARTDAALPVLLPPGHHRIAATLTAAVPDLPPGARRPPDAPTCQSEFDVLPPVGTP